LTYVIQPLAASQVWGGFFAPESAQKAGGICRGVALCWSSTAQNSQEVYKIEGCIMHTTWQRQRRTLPDLTALAVIVIWGTNFVFVKGVLAQFDALAFTFLRFARMITLAWAVILWQRRHEPQGLPSIGRGDWGRLALSGLLGYSLYMTLSIVGQEYTTAFSTALLIAITPIFTALLLTCFRLEPVAVIQWAGMAVSLAGVVLFLAEKLRTGWNAASFGDLISLAGVFCYAAYTVNNKPLLARYSAPVITAYTLTLGALPVLFFSAPMLTRQEWAAVTPMGWAVLLWSIVMPVYVAWTLWSWVSARIGVARPALYMMLVPVVSGVAAWLLLGEGFNALKLAGAAVTLAGLALARWGEGRRRYPQAPAQVKAHPTTLAVADS
jgi:drug/metabolite transporter (DMT)-like permease